MTHALSAAASIDRLLAAAERGLADPDRLLAPLAELTSRLSGVGGVGPGGVLWYDADGATSWWAWGWRMKGLVRDWIAAGRVLDRRELRRMKKVARPLFDTAREWSECLV